MIPKDTWLFACPDVDLAIDDAKSYCIDMRLTKDDIKIIRKGSQIVVVAIRDLE